MTWRGGSGKGTATLPTLDGELPQLAISSTAASAAEIRGMENTSSEIEIINKNKIFTKITIKFLD